MKKLTLTFIMMVITAIIQAQTIEYLYHYNQPEVITKDGYQQINLEGCLPTGQVGEPTLPWQSVSLMLPQGQEALSINVEFMDYVELEGSYNIYPYQQPRPYSIEKDIPFAKNENLYRSADSYPSNNFSKVNTQYLNGVAFAFSGFTPVQYVPATGKVSIASTVRVSVETTSSRDDHSSKLWLTPENKASIQRLAQNKDMIGSYNQRGREVNGYDMLVITAEEWIPRFGEYLNLYNEKGIRTQIVSLEQIYNQTTGRDEQEQIRSYIIQEYENNGISMVILGGDVAIVPFRYLWCFAQEGEEDQLPSDMYYACLDGTLNDDNDDRWGEVGEDDLLPELGIGRLPFNNEDQFNIIMQKTFSYLRTPVLGEFTSPILGAEHLGDGYYGSDDMERLIGTNSDFDYTTHGYPTDYNFKRFYASPTMGWSGTGFKNLIGTGGQYVHHVGHANTGIVANWDISMMGPNFFANNDGVNHNYMLFHSHGCICGDFSHGCILERMVTIPTGFVLTTGNSRYGWYVPWGDGMAAHIHREFVDAYCHDHIPSVGMALREAKIATAPWVTVWGEEGCLRWNIYCLNALGDGALCPWFEEPFTPNVRYEQGLVNGATTTQVHVSHFDDPLDNFSVSLYYGETLLARSITDANGNAELIFSPALDVDGDMQLIVSGQSAWPQILDVNLIANDEAFVYGEIIGFEGEPEYGTNSLWINADLYNKGAVAANNVHAAITSDCEYIVSHESNFTIDEFEPNSNQHVDHIGAIDIANNVPDQTLFTLYLTTYVGDVTNITQKSFLAKAPNLQFSDVVIDDDMGDGNGYADPGEQITLHINGMNIGHAIAPNTYLTVTCDNPKIRIEDETVQIGEIGPNNDFTANLNFQSDSDIISGTMVHLNMELHTGEYTASFEYLLTIGIVLETFESGDFNFTEWEHYGDQHWNITNEDAHTGSFSARSGAIDDDEVSNLVITAEIFEDSEISFWFKTSTEYHKDYFAFFIDNTMKQWWSGENDWTYVSFNFEAGKHVFRWLYDKNQSNNSGSDCAWIDDVTLPRACIVTKVEEIVTQKPTDIYPNPCDGSFNLKLETMSEVKVFNTMGQNILTLHQVEGIQQIHLNDAPSGMYLIQIQNEAGVEAKKLLVK